MHFCLGGTKNCDDFQSISRDFEQISNFDNKMNIFKEYMKTLKFG